MRLLGNLLLLTLVIAGAGSLWLGKGKPLPGFLEGSPAEGEPPPTIQVDPLEAPVHLRVLNGTQESGLAASFALLLPGYGCVVEGIGNAPHWPESPSVLLNRRLSSGQANELAQRLGGIPVLREWDGRTTEDAVLVLGSDHGRLRVFLTGS